MWKIEAWMALAIVALLGATAAAQDCCDHCGCKMRVVLGQGANQQELRLLGVTRCPKAEAGAAGFLHPLDPLDEFSHYVDSPSPQGRLVRV